MRAVPLLALALLCASEAYGQAEWPKPDWEKVESADCSGSGKPLSLSVGTYTVRLVPGHDADNGEICRAYLVGRDGRQTFLLRDSAISIHQGTGEDVFGNGNPSLILEGSSGGAHCCYTYKIVSLSETPLILAPIENETPFFFFKDTATGQYRIMTSDGAFDYFDGLCHACTPFPRIILKVEATGLRNVSSQFIEQYDSEITLARAKIADGDIQKFKAADFGDVKKVVLEIVLGYLYSGRETQAWQTLDEMWPTADRERIKKLILHTEAHGLLSKLGRTRPAARRPYTPR